MKLKIIQILNRYSNIAFFLICLTLFFVMYRLSSKIDFMQNDDWVHYQQVQSFMDGNYKLDEYFGPTFYTQGLIGMVFGKFIGIDRLPILTLLMSLGTLFMVFKILHDFMDRNLFDSILVGLLFFFVPLNMYSIWGFMTESYLLFFIIVSVYFFLLYERMHQTRYFLLTVLFFVLAFFVKQSALVLPAVFTIYSLLKKDFESTLFNGMAFILLTAFFFLFFPQTEAMKGKSFAFNHLYDFEYIYALVYGTLVIGAALFIPLLLNRIDLINTIKDWKKALLIIGLSTALFFGFNALFEPQNISWGEFPYFENIYERTGFYPRGVHGTKYQFAGNYDLYRYWDLGAKIMLSVFIAYIIVKNQLRVQLSLVFIVMYLGMTVVLDTFYDRYILIVLPFIMFFVVKDISFNLLKRAILLLFVLFMGYYSYQFSMDFVKVNDYVWNRSKKLVQDEAIPERTIFGTNAWKLKYRNASREYQYIFSYDSQSINPELECCYDLVEEKEIVYSGNFFIDPKIYLYKKSDSTLIF
jgi:hypothetical protein